MLPTTPAAGMPLTLGRNGRTPTTLRNRLASAPMERNYGTTDGHITEQYIDYLVTRARAGLGMVTTEATYVLGYEVHMNRPYAGGYITEHYGRPARDVHAVQIEINRGLYLDELSLQPTAGFAKLQRNLQSPERAAAERTAGAVRAPCRRRVARMALARPLPSYAPGSCCSAK